MPSRCLALPLLVGAIVLPQSQAIQTPFDLSPARWDQRERERLESLNTVMGQDKAPAHAANGKGIITATSSVLAVKAGLVALDQGGTAADAALTTAITQVCLAAGSWVSYAGIFTMVYYDAESRTLANLNAAFNTVLDEDAPLTIPAASEGPSGRTALVPGFIAGVEAAHHRFGKLPFAQLFQPAIHYAEQGFPLHAIHAAMLAERRAVLTRLPQTRRMFTRADGQLHAQGDVFRQPELAETLRQIAAQGARFMYRGPWAEHFVAAVQRDGGKLTRRDLERYEPIWQTPVKTTYRGVEIFGHGLPALGGVHTIEALNLAEAADLNGLGRYSTSSEAFFWLTQIDHLCYTDYLEPPALATMFKGLDLSAASRLRKASAEAMFERMAAGDLAFTQAPRLDDHGHSDAIVAVDARGNIAAVVHSINTSAWGGTGIFVDGISIPDSASFQQAAVRRAGKGERLPDPTEPLIVLQDGAPICALASIGAGLHEKTFCVLVDLLDHDLGIKAAIDAPAILLPAFGAGGMPHPQIHAGAFDSKLLAAVRQLGLEPKVLPASDLSPCGWVVGVELDPRTGVRTAAAPATFNGAALGQ